MALSSPLLLDKINLIKGAFIFESHTFKSGGSLPFPLQFPLENNLYTIYNRF